MFQQQSMLVTYDTTDDDDAKFGVGLGCNGIIHILIEPIRPGQENHPISLLKKCLADRRDQVLLTVFDLKNKRSAQIGTCLLWNEEVVAGSWEGLEGCIASILEDVKVAHRSGSSIINRYNSGSPLHAFIEVIKPRIELVIVGAGNDAIPLVELASILGWGI